MHKSSFNFQSFAVIVAIIAVPALAHAAILSTTGAVVVSSPPADIRTGAWESNTTIRAFAEQQNVRLAHDVSIDVTVPGTSPTSLSQNLSPGTIKAGTSVDSYFLHFDVVGSPLPQNAISAAGSITLDRDILGIAILSATLDATDATFGLPGVSYATSQFGRGLEITPGQIGMSNDEITLNADRRTVSVILSDAQDGDELRILTVVPEPSSLLLLAMALILPLARLLRRRTR